MTRHRGSGFPEGWHRQGSRCGRGMQLTHSVLDTLNSTCQRDSHVEMPRRRSIYEFAAKHKFGLMTR